ncbi:MAG TPA: phosphatase PAP2 family protein [Bacteroidia bacterium]|nr:phosphatase PAP2 family protein [Bacteroidia bacterium]
MMKGSIICLMSITLFFQGYSQSDTIYSVVRDTIPKDSASVIPPFAAETKIVLNKKEQIYTLKPGVDIQIIAVGTVFSLYAFTVIYDKAPSTAEEINSLKVSDINSFDRWSIYPYKDETHLISAIQFHASIPLPFIMFLITKDTRQDFWKLSFLYWETLSITGLFGAGAPYFIDRHRPYTYTSETPMEKRMTPNAKNSAFSGHVEVVAASTFFIAKVYSDYYPEKKLMMFSLASVATGGMAYLRLMQGMHFPSDIVIGAAIGTLSGILVPHFHKTKSTKAPALGIMPYSTGDINGLVLTYKFNK